MPGGVSFCPSRPITTAAFVFLVRVCAMQASAISQTSGTHGTPAVVAAPSTVQRWESGTFFRGAGQERSLVDEGCSGDEEGSLFVDSLITNLKNPIGGCYKSSSITNSSTSEYPSYALGGGGPTKGQAWIYVTNAGIWVIGIVEETDEATGEASSPKTVCSSFNNLNDHADELSGPTDPQLNGVWKCSYFEAGKTNRVEADFEGVECGCAGRTISQSSGSGDYSSSAIAIATLAALVALLLLVCMCLVHLKKRKALTHNAVAPSKEEPTASTDSLAPKEDPLPPQGSALASAEDSLAPTEDALAPTEHALALDRDTLAPKDALASTEQTLDV